MDARPETRDEHWCILFIVTVQSRCVDGGFDVYCVCLYRASV